MDAMQRQLLEAAIRMGVTLAPAQQTISVPVTPAPPAQPVIETTAVPAQADATPLPAPVAVVDPPLMKPEWEKEIDDTIARHGGTMTIPLKSGAVIRIVAEPKPATDAVEVGYETFKRLSRAAAVLNGRVVDIVTKEQADARTKAIIDSGNGCWLTPHIFIEVDKSIGIASRPSSDFSIIAPPKAPPAAPAVNTSLWLTLSGSSIIDNIPMRVNKKVVGTLIKTVNGPLYGRTVKETDHKLNLHADWALAGGYTIEREAYDKYLTDPSTVIKIIRGDRVYFTTSEWIQRYAGIIKQWGSDRIVMPLSGNYWMVVTKNGEPTQ